MKAHTFCTCQCPKGKQEKCEIGPTVAFPDYPIIAAMVSHPSASPTTKQGLYDL